MVWIQLERDRRLPHLFEGLWSYRKGQLCYWPDGPQFKSCAREHIGGKKVGDTWLTTGPNGAIYNAQVMHGQLGR